MTRSCFYKKNKVLCDKLPHRKKEKSLERVEPNNYFVVPQMFRSKTITAVLFHMTVKSKAIALVSFVIIALSAFYSFQQLSLYKRHLTNHLAEEKKDLENTLASCQKIYSATYSSWLENFIDQRKENIRAFAEQDRQRLFTLTLPQYESLKQLFPYLEIMHFHLPDGRSFLRMHNPEVFNDDLRRIRPAIQEVHKHKEKIKGFEIGIYGTFYRIIHPVFYQDEYIGALELGIQAKELVDSLQQKTDMETALFFANPLWEKASLNQEFQKKFSDYTVVGAAPSITDTLPADFSFDKNASKFESEGKHYLAFSLKDLKNCLQQPIGGVISIHDSTADILLQKRFLIQSLLITLSLGAFCVIFLSINFQNLIGDLERSEKALQQSEIKHRHILNTLPDTVFLLDEDVTVQWANKSALELQPDFLGKKCNFCQYQTSQPRKNCFCKSALDSGNTLTETIHLSSFPGIPGHSYWEVIAIPQKDQAGNVGGILVVLRNITQRVLSAQKADQLNRQNRLLLEAAGEGIYGVDIEGRTTFMNPAAERMTGFTEEEIIGNNQHELLHHTKIDGSAYPVCDCPVHLTIKQSKTHYVVDEIFWRKDGSSFPVEYIATPVLEENTVIGAVVLFSDITERKTLEKQLLHAQKMEAIGRLTSGIAHDFNNVLTTIIGYSELLMRQLDEEDKKHDQAKMIFQAGKMASSLTRQLLAFSRKQILETKTININTIIEKLEKMLRRLIGENISLNLHYGSGDCTVLADPSQCEQVLMNLAVNAKDAMPNGGNLSISTEIIQVDGSRPTGFDDNKPGPYILLSISDTGEGMTEETQKMIFEPFFTTKEMGKGTGLGLATVFGIIKQHNGFISVTSAPGQGTTFDICFPLSDQKPEEMTESAALLLPEGSETILVVDDTADIRQLIKDSLEPLGYTILEAENGAEAVKIFKSHGQAIDLLMTDMVMPGMSGRELAATLSRLNPAIKTLYMSGYKDASFGVDDLPSDSFLNKPLIPREMAKKIKKILLQPTG